MIRKVGWVIIILHDNLILCITKFDPTYSVIHIHLLLEMIYDLMS